jgi:hypothetical protein
MSSGQALANKENEIRLHEFEERLRRDEARSARDEARMQRVDERQDGLEAENIVNKYDSVISSKLTKWIDDQADDWHNALDDAKSALMLADHYYTDVLSAKEKLPWLQAVVSGLISGLAVVDPQFAMMAAVFQLSASGDKDRQEKLRSNLEVFQKAYEQYKDNREKAEKGERGVRQRKAQVGVLQYYLNECSKTSHWVSGIKSVLKDIVADNPNVPFAQMQAMWGQLVGFSKCSVYVDGTDDQWARLFLYDMLRRYCRESVQLIMPGPFGPNCPISTGEARRMVASGDGSCIELRGLEPAKRTVMYGYFDGIDSRYLGPSRPFIRGDGQGWKDLINAWDFVS